MFCAIFNNLGDFVVFWVDLSTENQKRFAVDHYVVDRFAVGRFATGRTGGPTGRLGEAIGNGLWAIGSFSLRSRNLNKSCIAIPRPCMCSAQIANGTA